jgi:simple sugar transport system permease protein
VLVAGGIDISFTATATIAQYVALTLAIRHGLGWFAMFALSSAVGILCGLINAVFITKLRISSIIVSIATLNIFYGLLIFFTGGRYITSLPKFFRDGISWFEYEDASGVTYALNLQILVLVIAFVVAWLLLNRTNLGARSMRWAATRDACAAAFHIFRLNPGLRLPRHRLAAGRGVKRLTVLSARSSMLAAVVLSEPGGGVGSVSARSRRRSRDPAERASS